jgi:hypothetical protein
MAGRLQDLLCNHLNWRTENNQVCIGHGRSKLEEADVDRTQVLRQVESALPPTDADYPSREATTLGCQAN